MFFEMLRRYFCVFLLQLLHVPLRRGNIFLAQLVETDDYTVYHMLCETWKHESQMGNVGLYDPRSQKVVIC